jgi:hypothetical protein
MTYAVLTGDPHFHLMIAAGWPRTLCNLSTKGSLKNVREARPAGRVTREQPSPFLFSLCPLCDVAQSERLNNLSNKRVSD